MLRFSNRVTIVSPAVLLVWLCFVLPFSFIVDASSSSSPPIVTVDTSLSSASFIPTTYLGTTIDIATFVDHDHCNFTDPQLHAMTLALGCSTLRVGGTRGDVTYYNHFPAGKNVTSLSDLPPDFSSIFEYEQWVSLMEFVTAVNLTLFFGMNGGWGGDGLVRAPLGEGGAWLEEMFSWILSDVMTRNLTSRIAGFEFTNEPNLFAFNGLFPNETLSWALNGAMLARDVPRVKQVLQSVAPHWKLLCCDVAYVPLLGEIDNFVTDFATAGGYSSPTADPLIDAATFHFYPLFSSSYNRSLPPALDPFYASVEKVLDPLILDQVGFWADQFVKNANLSQLERHDRSTGKKFETQTSQTKATTTSIPVILGETGSAVGGGQNGLSNRYADVIEYVDKIGQMTTRGQQHMFRQTLCGSPDQYYALISHNLTASPSYFVTAFLNQLVLSGKVVIPASATTRTATTEELLFPNKQNSKETFKRHHGGLGEEEGLVAVYPATSSTALLRAYAYHSELTDLSTAPLPSNYFVTALLNLANVSTTACLVTTTSTSRTHGSRHSLSSTSASLGYQVNISSAGTAEQLRRNDVPPSATFDVLSSPWVQFNAEVAQWDQASGSITPSMEGSLLSPFRPSLSPLCGATGNGVAVGVPALGWTFVWLPLE